MSIGNFLESLSQAMLVGTMLVGRLGVSLSLVRSISVLCYAHRIIYFYMLRCIVLQYIIS